MPLVGPTANSSRCNRARELKAQRQVLRLHLPLLPNGERSPMGRRIIPVPTDAKCPRCGSLDIRSAGCRPLWNGERAPKYQCQSCRLQFLAAVPPKKPKRERAGRSADLQMREEARRGRLAISISLHPKILARLVLDCSELGVSSMNVYVAQLCETRHAELTVKKEINGPEKPDGRFRGWHRSNNPEKSSTSQALTVIRTRSEAARLAHMHRTHRHAATQEQT